MPVEIRSFQTGDRDQERPEDISGEILGGLSTNPKDLSRWPKYLYNERGSGLFEKITEQPEYYQTRTELSILERFADDIAAGVGDFGELVELGSGSSSKTRVLIDALARHKGLEQTRYVPLDVSSAAVEDGARSLAESYPGLNVLGYVGDFDGAVGEFLSRLTRHFGERLVIFLGGTIGNFTPDNRRRFLEGVSSGMSRGDSFLVGVDLVKDKGALESAYDDAAGITAEFNKNVLTSINEKTGANFDPGLFEHRAIYNEERSRIEMWLISTQEQEISLDGSGNPDLSVHFEAGEGVRTEISAKFTSDSAADMFEGSGLELTRLYTDDKDLFGLALARRR